MNSDNYTDLVVVVLMGQKSAALAAVVPRDREGRMMSCWPWLFELIDVGRENNIW